MAKLQKGITSKRIEELLSKLPEKTILEVEKCVDLLPYLDESEKYAFWLAISFAFLDGKEFGVKTFAAELNKISKGGH